MGTTLQSTVGPGAGTRPHCAPALALVTGAVAGAVAVVPAAYAQAAPSAVGSVAPSQVTPPAQPLPAPLPQGESLPTMPATPPSAMAPANDFPLRLSGAVLTGGYPDMVAAHAAFDQALRTNVRTLSGLFAAARSLEQAYADRGHVLVRVTVPPQRLAEGGKAEVVVIDGFVEAIDVEGVPPAVRSAVAARLGRLVGRRSGRPRP